MSWLNLLVWLVASLAIGGSLAAMLGCRPAVTLPGAATGAAAFTVLMGVAAAEGDRLAAVILCAGAVTDVVLFGSALRVRHRAPSSPPSLYPQVTRIRSDLDGHTITIEALSARAVAQRGEGEAPGTLAIVERRHGRFLRIVTTSPIDYDAPTLAASAADAIGAQVAAVRTVAAR